MPVYKTRRRRVQRVRGWNLQPVARGRARVALRLVTSQLRHSPGTITDEEYRRSIVRADSHFGVAGLYSGRAGNMTPLASSAIQRLPAAHRALAVQAPMLVGCCGSKKAAPRKRKRKRTKRGFLVGLARTITRKTNR